ncbi:MAG: Rieske 2Fe-2S domain-containing protein, partial [Deltaproteobacteria bacterium]|nr:Rieske 2Fe-2S domain-containing protein [Deltaproteobacteria bacterium]
AAPVVLARTEVGVRCLSNVCTHRANLIVDAPGCSQALRCRYHGRRFGLDGRFVSMPEFSTAANFPGPGDDLPVVPTGELGPLVFASLEPSIPFDQLVAPVRARTAFLPWERLVYAGARDYDIAAHWALYLENYLEGFHIPFVHAGLNQVIEYGDYRTETFDHGNVQIGIASGDPSAAFTLPRDHPDAGQRIAAWYFWLFPTTMINVYPWGLSMNAIIPLAPDRTRVRFATWIWDPAQRDRGAGADLHTVELEDEAVVENVQRGIRSPLYQRGRYSPTREIGVHHFHQLAVATLGSGRGV